MSESAIVEEEAQTHSFASTDTADALAFYGEHELWIYKQLVVALGCCLFLLLALVLVVVLRLRHLNTADASGHVVSPKRVAEYRSNRAAQAAGELGTYRPVPAETRPFIPRLGALPARSV